MCVKCENWTTTSGELLQVQYYSSDFHYSAITTLDHPTSLVSAFKQCSKVEYHILSNFCEAKFLWKNDSLSYDALGCGSR